MPGDGLWERVRDSFAEKAHAHLHATAWQRSAAVVTSGTKYELSLNIGQAGDTSLVIPFYPAIT
jgi:hypothetical protein